MKYPIVTTEDSKLSHIPGVVCDYVTLCGLDGTDHYCGQEILGKSDILTCSHCYNILKNTLKYKKAVKDFRYEGDLD